MYHISRVSCIFSVYTRGFRRACIPRKYNWQVGYPMVYNESALNNYFIPCHRNYSGQYNQCDIRATHDGKVECNSVEYKAAFLYPDWLYFLWHGLNAICYLRSCQRWKLRCTCFVSWAGVTSFGGQNILVWIYSTFCTHLCLERFPRAFLFQGLYSSFQQLRIVNQVSKLTNITVSCLLRI